jgi:ADP-ribosylglycohydrolase
MLGAIAGDVIGSIYEHRPIKTTKFPLFHPLCRFTDDTVLTVALADHILHGNGFVGLMKQWLMGSDWEQLFSGAHSENYT